MSLQTRELTVQFSLFDPATPGGATFDATGDNTLTASGLRVSASIKRVGVGGMDTATISVWGLPPSITNKLSTLGKPLLSGNPNYLTLFTEVDGQRTTAYIGPILASYVDGRNQPSVPLVVTCNQSLLDATRTIPPTSFPGNVDVASAIQGLAVQAGKTLQNFGVTTQLGSQYLCGSAWDQAKQIAHAAGIVLIHDDTNSQWAIWPQSGARNPTNIPMISPATGLKDYPVWSDASMLVETLYNPQIQFGGYVQVQSSVQRACGKWLVFNAGHELESQVFNGKWFTSLELSVIGQAVPLAQL